MSTASAGRRRQRSAAPSAVIVAALLAGCAGADADPAGTPEPAAFATRAEPSALPSSHVHAVAVAPADDRVYLATHDGLFRYDTTGPTRVGPIIDLMGFHVAGPDHITPPVTPARAPTCPSPSG